MFLIRILAYLFAPITVFFCLKSVNRFLNPKPGKGFFLLRLLGVSLLAGMVIFIGDPVNFIPTVLIFVVAVSLSYQNSFWQKLAVAVMISSLGLSFATLVSTFLDAELWSSLKFLFWVVLYFFIRKYGPEPGYYLSDSLWKLLLYLSVIPLGIVVTVVLGLPGNVDNRSPDMTAFYHTTVSAVAVILLLLAVFSFFGLLSSVKVLSRQYRMEQEQILNEMNRQYYNNLEQQQLEIRKLRHDMVHHLQALTLLTDEARTDYLNNLLEHPSLKYNASFCENRIVNAVLGAKLNAIRELGIDFHFRLLLPDDIPMENPDLCAVFANCLSNAIEACEKLSPPLRNISLESRFEKNFFLLCCTNPMPDALIIKDGKILTGKRDKRNHGIGISSIQEVVRRYNGTVDLSVSEAQFKLSVTMILPSPSQDIPFP